MPVGRDADLDRTDEVTSPPLTIEVFNPRGELNEREVALKGFAAEVQADLVLVGNGAPGASYAPRLAAELDAPLVLRWGGQDAITGEALVSRAREAALILVPSAEAHSRLIGALADTDVSTPILEIGDGVDVPSIAPPARGAIDPEPCPPLGAEDRCVLVEAESAGPGSLADLACDLAPQLTQHRSNLHVVVAVNDADSPSPANGRLHWPGPLGHADRQAFRARARMVLLDDCGRATTPRRLQECVATGALPMARSGGGLGDGMEAVAKELPRELAEALTLPTTGALEPDELRARIEFVLDHPDTPYLAPRLTSLAQREFDWCVRAYEYERVLGGLTSGLGSVA